MKYENIIREIPEEYAKECVLKGRIEKIEYDTTDRFDNPDHKYAFVYLPYNYDANKKYEIMYLIHGGGETAEKYLYQDGENNKLKKIVDHLIYSQEIKETIIVTPTWYRNNNTIRELSFEENNLDCAHFPVEMVDLMKAVESRYSTFAETADDKGFRESRNHRSIAGWSQGNNAIWYVFMEHAAYFDRYGIMSGDSWAICVQGGKLKTRETVQLVTDAAYRQNLTKKDFFLYEITGSNDGAFDMVAPMVACYKAYPDLFEFEGKNQNASLLVWKDGEHHTQWRIQYTYNVLRNFLG